MNKEVIDKTKNLIKIGLIDERDYIKGLKHLEEHNKIYENS